MPWKVDELAGWYKPHERARYSCVNCSGDVVPEFDLVGCWPLWPQFGPDEMSYRCTRQWSTDPGVNRPNDFLRHAATLPCWQTCWTPLPGKGGARHCTAPCPKPADAEAGIEWRARWDRELADFKALPGPGREVEESTRFIRPMHSTSFMWGVF